MTTISGTIRALILSCLLLVLAGSAYGILLGVIRFESHRVSELKQEIDLALEQEEHLSGLRLLLKDLSDEYAELSSFFIPQDGVVDFLETIESLSEISGADVSVDSVGVEPDARSGKESEITELLGLSVVFSGSWREVYYALTLLESFPLQVSVKRASISRVPATSSEWEGLVDVEFGKLK